MAYSAPLIGFPHYHRNHASTPDIKRKKRGCSSDLPAVISRSTVHAYPLLPIHNTTTLAQRANHLREGEGFVQTIVLMDSDTLTGRAGEGLDFYAVDSTQYVFVPIDGIQERNLASITLSRKINHCSIPHFQRL